MKLKQRITAILLFFVLTLTGCGKEASEIKTGGPLPETETVTETEAVSEAPNVTENEPAPEPEPEPEPETETEAALPAVVLGDEQFDAYLPLLEGKKVALLTNQTGIVGDAASFRVEDPLSDPDSLIRFGKDRDGNDITYGEHILDALVDRNVNVTAVFSPEHGFRGEADAGETVENAVDEKTGVPLISLYGNGNTNGPADSDMERFDTLVVDMQDVGLRYFTYYISLYNMMDACAAWDKEVVLLDRPNPNGFYVDGPILQEPYKSGVGRLPIPIVYGMTWGELAQMINGEGWLSEGRTAELTVIPCLNYTHQTHVPLSHEPSPNLKDMHAIYLYASTCYFENTVVSVGRGTELPFNAFGSPYFENVDGYGFSFTPQSMLGATEPPFLGETCYGKDLRTKPLQEIFDEGINLTYLIDAYHAYQSLGQEQSFFGKGSNDRYFIDLLCGTDEVRRQIEEGLTSDEIKASWKYDLIRFRAQRRPYLLYEDADDAAYIDPDPEMLTEAVLARMSLDQKIDQLLIVAPEILTQTETVTSAGDALREALEQHPVGGILYFEPNIVDPEQTKALLEATQSYAKAPLGVPLFACIDEEGGKVSRIAKNDAFDVPRFDYLRNVKSKEEAYEIGLAIGKYLKEYGFNLDFAPCADVLTNPENTVVKDRSFGPDPAFVSDCVGAYCSGLHESGILSTIKHFPGHGSTVGDTHEGFALTERTLWEMKEAELIPFQRAGELGADAVMTAHISVPAITGDNTPATLSEAALNGVLRQDLGYDGLIVTDALNMKAISDHYGAGEACVLALKAGADLLLMPVSLTDAENAIKAALSSGELSEDRIDLSVRRILMKKFEAGL